MVEAVARIAKERGVERVHVALAWLLAKNPVISPIIGATRTSHIDGARARPRAHGRRDRRARGALRPPQGRRRARPGRVHPRRGSPDSLRPDGPARRVPAPPPRRHLARRCVRHGTQRRTRWGRGRGATAMWQGGSGRDRRASGERGAATTS
ncbi:aldo/keto reductase [Brachybacterium conglomeratum]|uniref:aldo/keto reductase n=1 Tax=Brachybacterium conglomeratum TaxID=47846 RepID=UPI0035F0ABC7